MLHVSQSTLPWESFLCLSLVVVDFMRALGSNLQHHLQFLRLHGSESKMESIADRVLVESGGYLMVAVQRLSLKFLSLNFN